MAGTMSTRGFPKRVTRKGLPVLFTKGQGIDGTFGEHVGIAVDPALQVSVPFLPRGGREAVEMLHARGIANTENRKVWVFCGDGEMDEVESLGAISLAARENLDNLIFVVNCNLQRLDGPVRGNGKIIQELEGEFRGSGWNVIKLIWGSYWDPLLARDKEEILRKVMMDTVDGDYQAMKANDGAFVRKHFFGRHPKALEMVAKMSDEDIWRLNRGGHDPQKVYAAYHKAVNHKGQPTVLLIKTVKGFGMGKTGEGKNTAHQTKKMVDEDVKVFRDRFNIPIPDDKIAEVPFYKPADDTPEMRYLHERRKALGGYLPQRRPKAEEQFTVPPLETFKAVLEPTADGFRNYLRPGEKLQPETLLVDGDEDLKHRAVINQILNPEREAPPSAAYLQQLVEHELRATKTISGVSRQRRVPETVDRIAPEHRFAIADREERVGHRAAVVALLPGGPAADDPRERRCAPFERGSAGAQGSASHDL